MDALAREFEMLCRQWGRAQTQCAAAMAQQAQQIDALNAQVVRLRGTVLLKTTQAAWLAQPVALAGCQHAADPGWRDEDASEEPFAPALHRHARARQTEPLRERMAAHAREAWCWRQAAAPWVAAWGHPAADAGSAATATATERSPSAAIAPAQPCPADAGVAADARTDPPARQEEPQATARRAASWARVPPGDAGSARGLLDTASYAAAQWVICQTGCISHGGYWREQDFCRRTGQPCAVTGAVQAPPEGSQPVAPPPGEAVRSAHARAPVAE